MTEVLIKHNVSSLLDIPFGDYNWTRLVKMPMCKKYLGADIVQALVDENYVDAIFCGDCLGYLSFEYIFSALMNIKNSGGRLLMTTTWEIQSLL